MAGGVCAHIPPLTHAIWTIREKRNVASSFKVYLPNCPVCPLRQDFSGQLCVSTLKPSTNDGLPNPCKSFGDGANCGAAALGTLESIWDALGIFISGTTEALCAHASMLKSFRFPGGAASVMVEITESYNLKRRTSLKLEIKKLE